jgi:2-polyprenyl-6-hydroxyphenyl methylase/3-demethylubiquinone-9 3-methyltransferase
VPVDNEIYNRAGDIWWDEREPLSLLRSFLNPPRTAYIRAILGRLHIDPADAEVLDVGCGGGLLAEEVARLGCRVTGVDPSAASIATARAHGVASGLRIDYRIAAGEALPFPDKCFDLVCCCDVLEHVESVDAVIAETARALKPGGVFIYDTINRTLLSRIVLVWLVQDLAVTRIAPPNLHDWRRFIRPGELIAALQRYRLRNQGLAGIEPGVGPLTMLGLYLQLKRGRITYAEFGRRLRPRLTRRTFASYIGYATHLSPRPPSRAGRGSTRNART